MNKFVKYLLCVLICILAINFLVNMISFFKYNHTYLIPARINANPKSDSFIDLGNQLESTLNTQIDDVKKENGDDYPALGIIYYKAVSHYSSVTTIQNFIFSLIAGFTLANMIFFIFILKLKQIKLTCVLILILALLSLLFMISDVYTSIANSEAIVFGISEFFWNMEVFAIPYIIVSIILIASNKIYETYHEIRYS